MRIAKPVCSLLLVLTLGISLPASAQEVSQAPAVYRANALGSARFLAVHGRKSLISGFASGALEVWCYPLQIVSGYRVGFRGLGQSSEISASSLLASITYKPEAIERTYVGPGFVVREQLFVPIDRPSALITYSVEGVTTIDVIAHFTPVLDLMWPAAIGGQSLAWAESSSGYRMTEPLGKFEAEIGSPEAVAHDLVGNIAQRPGEPNTFAITLRSTASKPATLVVSRIPPGGRSSVVSLASLKPGLEAEANAHYQDLAAKSLHIETPDDSLNRNLLWSQIALDQAWVCHDALGCGLVGGYGPSRGARRPQYDWFFAGDAMIAIRALLHSGEYQRARDALSFLIRYQDPSTGMMWHEMSQSANEVDWARKYPYMFVHVDLTFEYLQSMSQYAATTGDKAFLTQHWSSIQKAYHYCSSLIDNGDGLPRIPTGKEGANEQDRMRDDLQLSASWVYAARGYASVARMAGHEGDARLAENAAMRAEAALQKRYWNPKRQTWIEGFRENGAPFLDESVRPAELAGSGILTPQQEQITLDRVASSEFQTDWGTRGISVDSPSFDPDSYAKGSVWALSSAQLAVSYWAKQRSVTAYSLWNAVESWNTINSFGHIPEVLAGDFYHEEQESVPEQTFSSAAYLDAFVSGLAGIAVDSGGKQLKFSPHLPPDWSALRLTNLHVGSSSIALSLKRDASGLSLDLINDGPALRFLFAPEIPLGAKISGGVLDEHQLTPQIRSLASETDAVMEYTLPTGNSHFQIYFTGGAQLKPESPLPTLGDPSHGPKVIQFTGDGTSYSLTADVDRSRASTFTVFTPAAVHQVAGATLSQTSDHQFKLTVPATQVSSKPKYERTTVRFNIKP
jgi:glycogen debranching enzyme